MENKPVNLYKVTLTVSRIPKEVVWDVQKAIGEEKKNTWLIRGMELSGAFPMMRGLPKPKVITKRNIMNVSPAFELSDTICTTWCLEGDLERAKEACMDKMEWAVRKRVQRDMAMSEMFMEYKSKAIK